MRRMTTSEAVEMIETVFETEVESIANGIVEAFIGDMDTGRAWADVESYLSQSDCDPDLGTITIAADKTDPPSVDCISITIKTEG